MIAHGDFGCERLGADSLANHALLSIITNTVVGASTVPRAWTLDLVAWCLLSVIVVDAYLCISVVAALVSFSRYSCRCRYGYQRTRLFTTQ